MALIDALDILSRQRMITVLLSFHLRRAEMTPGDIDGVLPALPRGTWTIKDTVHFGTTAVSLV